MVDQPFGVGPKLLDPPGSLLCLEHGSRFDRPNFSLVLSNERLVLPKQHQRIKYVSGGSDPAVGIQYQEGGNGAVDISVELSRGDNYRPREFTCGPVSVGEHGTASQCRIHGLPALTGPLIDTL